jgi:hypothetical protein
MNSFQAIYDVNSTGNPFHASIYEHQHDILNNFVGLPPTMQELNTTAPTPIVAEPQVPDLMRRFADIFCSKSITKPDPIPINNNDVFGNTMPTPAPANTTHLYFINLNGLNLQKNAVKFRDLCEELRKADVHLFAAAEHNLETNKFAVRKSLQDNARRSFPHYNLQTATSSTLADKFYKPGGYSVDGIGRPSGKDQRLWEQLLGTMVMDDNGGQKPVDYHNYFGLPSMCTFIKLPRNNTVSPARQYSLKTRH